MRGLLDQLTGGDRRSIGRSNAVVRQVLSDPSKFAEIIAGMSADDALVRMRSADAAEKVSAVHPEWLRVHKKAVLDLAARASQQELRWHLAQMLPRLALSPAERAHAVRIMFESSHRLHRRKTVSPGGNDQLDEIRPSV